MAKKSKGERLGWQHLTEVVKIKIEPWMLKPIRQLFREELEQELKDMGAEGLSHAEAGAQGHRS